MAVKREEVGGRPTRREADIRGGLSADAQGLQTSADAAEGAADGSDSRKSKAGGKLRDALGDSADGGFGVPEQRVLATPIRKGIPEQRIGKAVDARSSALNPAGQEQCGILEGQQGPAGTLLRLRAEVPRGRRGAEPPDGRKVEFRHSLTSLTW